VFEDVYRVYNRGGSGRAYSERFMDAAPVLTDPRLLEYDTSECAPTDTELPGTTDLSALHTTD